jgi:hypothetical protein
MDCKTQFVVSTAVAAVVAVLLSAPVEAGTCVPVKAKGFANNIAKATTLAQIDLTKKAASLRGKVTQTSTNCVPGPAGRYVQDIGGCLPQIDCAIRPSPASG